MIGIESTGMEGIRGNYGGGGMPAPSGFLRRAAEVTPAGVVICAACHPEDCRGVRAGGGRSGVVLHIAPLPGSG